MAAGLGYKEFATGDVLTAADANGYLASQVVMVFASAAARTSAIASPQEGMISYLKDTDVTQYYSGSAWTTIGGSASPLTTKGDLYTYSTTNARLGVGANGRVLVADSAEATGLKWAPAGKILQVVSTTKLDSFSTTSTSMVDVTGLSVSITPTASTSTILVFMNVMNSHSSGSNAMNSFNLVRGSTAIAQPSAGTDIATTQSNVVASSYLVNAVGFTVDSPATTSATTYKVQMRVTGTTTGYVNRRGDNSNITAVSSLYVMEIGA
jgi:hypothetical protein